VGKGERGKGTSFFGEREREERKKAGGEREKNSSWQRGGEIQSEQQLKFFEKKVIRDRALRLPDANERLGIETQN